MTKIEKQFYKQKRKRNSFIRKWWRKNKYKIAKIIFFYIWIPVFVYEKIKYAQYKNLKYNSNITKKYLDKVMPKLTCQYVEDLNCILFHDADDFDGIHFYWNLCSNWMKTHFKKETKYFSKFDKQTQKYIIKEYQIDGYKKLILDNWVDWNKAKERFNWTDTPYDLDYAKGVLFYKNT